MNTFLPENYEPPKSNDHYLKLQDGDTKIRIISKPIIGYEDWRDNKPIRYKQEQKPESSFDPKRPIKHFWSFIVWSYKDERIMIYHVTQVSVIKALTDLVRDEDWGSPFNYDIKITKSGKEMQTKYVVTPLPHKICPLYIKEAFEAKPCNLEAMYYNEDPFAPSINKTEGCFSEKIQTITEDQYAAIIDSIGDDKDIFRKIKEEVQETYNCTLQTLPQSKLDVVFMTIKNYKTKSNPVPF
jgi:hypothetical protein